MNNHQVATPEMMLEEARSYILFIREPDGRLSAYIGLHLLTTDRRLYYTHASNPFPFRALTEIEEEALAFVEGLGAMLDSIDFTRMSLELRNQWIDKQEIFHVKTAVVEVALETEVQATEVIEPDETALPGKETRQAKETTPSEPPAAAVLTAQPEKALPQETVKEASSSPAPPASATTADTQHLSATPPPQPPAQNVRPVPQPAPASEKLSDAGGTPGTQNIAALSVQPPARQAGGIPDTGSGSDTLVQKPDTIAPSIRRQDVMQQSIRAGIVKPPQALNRSGVRESTETKKRDRESIARLLSSF